MNIREACLMAKKEGRGITRKSYGPDHQYICQPIQQLAF
ncbi:Uncharacterised protein [Lactobacillus acidophilus]|jgi:hypothetical protein|nr:hypothetical protein HMPREF0507_02219 [Lactobacillus crispatus MV-1A-US]MBI1712474.1 hypothetical protein [Lactobacillus crispatus]QPP17218.1 hypothetical protein PRL2021_1072 [Lactobacillus crispatus]STX17935.1 Uncharacterised protein [Lactobacillus acidophilus]DAW29757.1 MAG TPA: Protein of unknown function (DUF2829) [Caudoviricetes sp.]